MTGGRCSRLLSAAAAAILTLTAAAVIASPAVGAADGTVRVATLNVCGSYLPPGCQPTQEPGAWTTSLVAQLTDWSPDVVMFQEMCAGQRDRLLAQMRGYRAAWRAARGGVRGCQKWGGALEDGQAVFVRATSVKTLSVELDEMYDGEPRTLLCAQATITGRESFACSVHLADNLIDQGTAQATAQIDAWAGGRPVILGGDFNADPQDPVMGLVYSAQGGTGGYHEVDERNVDYFSPNCAGLRACRSGRVTTAGAQPRKFDYLFASGSHLRWQSGDTVDPHLTVNDHLLLRGVASWQPDTAPPTTPVVDPPSRTLWNEGRDYWSGALDMVTGSFTSDDVDDLVVRWNTGVVDLFAGQPGGGLQPPVPLRTSENDWSDAIDIAAGNFDGQGKDDLVVRWRANSVFLYPGLGDRGLGPSVPVMAGGALSSAVEITGGDLNGAGPHDRDDLLARLGDGSLVSYRLLGAQSYTGPVQLMAPGRLSDAVHIAAGALTMPAGSTPAEPPNSRDDDLLVRWNSGRLYAYPGDTGFVGGITLQEPPPPRPGSTSSVNTVTHDLAGDFDKRHPGEELVSRSANNPPRVYALDGGAPAAIGSLGAGGDLNDAADTVAGAFLSPTGDNPGGLGLVVRWNSGNLFLYPFKGTQLGDRVALEHNWVSAAEVVAGDVTGDGREEVLVRWGPPRPGVTAGESGPAGTIAVASFTADGTLGVPVTLPAPQAGWCGASTIAETAAGDLTADGVADLVLRCADGSVLAYPVHDHAAGPAKVLRSSTDGWSDAASLFVADMVGDKNADVIVRWRSGSAFAYPGDGTGGIGGSQPLRGAGAWADAAEVGARDLTGDGLSDVLVRWNSGGLLTYPTGSNEQAPRALTLRAYDQDGSGVHHFEYAVDDDLSTSAHRIDAVQGRARLPLPALTSGTHILRAVAVDRAGNRSPQQLTYSFTAAG